jgi:hypothetical protein
MRHQTRTRDQMQTDVNRRRRPVEAIEQRTRRSLECEQRVRKALAKLAKTGVSFTVEDVCNLASVGKTFIYDKRHPELTKTILAARDVSQVNTTRRAELHVDENTSSWRERALNAEALAKTLRAGVKERDARIADLTGQLRPGRNTPGRRKRQTPRADPRSQHKPSGRPNGEQQPKALARRGKSQCQTRTTAQRHRALRRPRHPNLMAFGFPITASPRRRVGVDSGRRDPAAADQLRVRFIAEIIEVEERVGPQNPDRGVVSC